MSNSIINMTNDERFPKRITGKTGGIEMNNKIVQTRYYAGNDYKLVDAPDIDWAGAKMFYEFIHVTEDFPAPPGEQLYRYDAATGTFIEVDSSYQGEKYYNHSIEITDTNTLLSVIENLPKWVGWEEWNGMQPINYTVSFYVDNVLYAEITAAEGTVISTILPSDPVVEGYVFDGWMGVGGITINDQLTNNARFDAELTPVADTWKFIGFAFGRNNVDYGSTGELREELKDTLNTSTDGIAIDWISEIGSTSSKVYWNQTSSAQTYCSYRISSSGISGELAFTANKHIKLLLGKYTSEATVVGIDIDGSFTTKNNIASITNEFYDNHINQEVDIDLLPEEIQYNIIDIQDGQTVRLYPNNSTKRRFNIVGIFIKSSDIDENAEPMMLTMLGGVPRPKYLVVFDGGLDGDDYEMVVTQGNVVNVPSDVNVPVEQGYTFGGWRCITDPTFEIGVTTITQDLEFEPIFIQTGE